MSNLSNTEFELNDALQRAKQLATSIPTTTSLASPTNGQKRSHQEDEDNYDLNSIPAKRSNNNGMAAMAGMGMGGPIGGDPLVETIEVPDSAVGLVIGRGGEQISQIQQQSGCRVQMAGESMGTGMRQCTLQGPKHCIDKARQLIEEVITRSRQPGGMGGGGGLSQNGGGGGGNYVTQELLIPGPKCGLIIGKNGETIKSLQEQIGVKMLLIQDSQQVSVGPKPLRITGCADKVEQAKRAV
jgi:far upstream element-binding protein